MFYGVTNEVAPNGESFARHGGVAGRSGDFRMGYCTCGDKYCVDDGVDSADRDNVAAFELWWDKYAIYGGGARVSVATFLLHEPGSEDRRKRKLE